MNIIASYQPEVRTIKGVQPLLRPAMSAICDVCGKSRTRPGGHDKCSKIRQAAGFIIKQESHDENSSAALLEKTPALSSAEEFHGTR